MSLKAAFTERVSISSSRQMVLYTFKTTFSLRISITLFIYLYIAAYQSLKATKLHPFILKQTIPLDAVAGRLSPPRFCVGFILHLSKYIFVSLWKISRNATHTYPSWLTIYRFITHTSYNILTNTDCNGRIEHYLGGDAKEESEVSIITCVDVFEAVWIGSNESSFARERVCWDDRWLIRSKRVWINAFIVCVTGSNTTGLYKDMYRIAADNA